ncbi:MAG: carotenoid oxygenase family protein, partial [Actinomycetota bacterium]
AITDRDVVFWEFPVVFDIEMAVGGENLPFRWDASYGARIGVMPLGGRGEEIRWVEVPPAYVFHGINAFRDGDEIVVDVSQFETMFEDGPLGSAPALHRWRLDVSGDGAPVFTDEVRGSDRQLDLATRDPRVVGRPNRFGYLLEAVDTDAGIGFGGLVKRDVETLEDDYFDPGPGRAANEGLFVPTGEAEDDGYVLSYVYDAARDGSDLVVLDAHDLAAGPVAVVELPQRVPHGFHATWVPAEGA